MKIKTFLVSSLSEAVDKIKKEMGPKAVILSTRKVSSKEKWWLPPQLKLEVTAGIGSEEELFNSQSLNSSIKNIDPAIQSSLAFVQEELKTSQKINSPQPSFEFILDQVPPANFVDTQEKKEKFNLNEKQKICLSLFNHLKWHQIDLKILETFFKNIKASSFNNLEELKELAASWLLAELAPLISEKKIKERGFVFIGPTGAGKTTTLLKLAYLFTLKEKKSVALIAIDFNKSGKDHFLLKHAALLNIPFRVVAQEKQFKKALNDFSSADILLIDTEGISVNSFEEIEKIRKFFPEEIGFSKELVLPIALHEPDLARLIHHFNSLSFNHLILTKLDETECFGTLFNAPFLYQTPLSYFTTGQVIPDDLEIATTERIVDCLLNFSGDFNVPYLEEKPSFSPENLMLGIM